MPSPLSALQSRSRWYLLGVALAVALSGCGSRGRKTVHPVHGQLLLNGRPVSHATVTFHPVSTAAEELRPSGQTDEEGNFRLTSYAAGDGAPEGQYAVTVTWLRAFPVPGSPEGEQTAYNVLPPHYASPAASQLT